MTDTDPVLTQRFQRIEQDFVNATLQKDAQALERLVAPQYTLRIADIPESSLPRAIWLDNTLHRLNAQSFEIRDPAARQLAENLTVMSFVGTAKGTMSGREAGGAFFIVDLWQNGAQGWQIIARYSMPAGKPPDRSPQAPPPPPTDVDAQLTDLLRRREQDLAEAALRGFNQEELVESAIDPDFALHTSDAPLRSIRRSEWTQLSRDHRIVSSEQRHHASRRLAADLAVTTLVMTQKATADGEGDNLYLVDIWRNRGDTWRILARYAGHAGKTLDRAPPAAPPP